MDRIAALFDFDGVIMDTESQYTIYWDKVGLDVLGTKQFGNKIKGQTLNNIMSHWFSDTSDDVKQQIIDGLYAFERQMKFEYIAGFMDFFKDLKANGVLTAVVTSSDMAKMENVYKAYPQFKTMFDAILTAEDFKASKPSPDCYLRGMKRLGTDEQHTFVFEDSMNGLKAGQASGAKVVGLATTYGREAIEPYCNVVIDDFVGFSFDSLMHI